MLKNQSGITKLLGAKSISAFALAFSSLILSLVYFSILSNLPRGLDWTDESFILNLIATNQTTNGEMWGFHHLLHPFWDLLGANILGLRMTRLVVTQFTAIFATLAIRSLSRHIGYALNSHQTWIILLSSSATSLYSWVYWPRAFGYNELATLLVTSAICILIILLCGQNASQERLARKLIFLVAILGFVVFLAILTKVTTGALLSILFVAVIFISDYKQRFKLLVAFLAGIILGVVIFVNIGFPFQNYFQSAIRILVDSGYSASFARPPGLVLTSALEVLRLFNSLIVSVLFLTVGIVFLTWRKSFDSNVWPAIKVLGLLLIFASVSTGFFNVFQQRSFFMAAALGGSLLVFGSSAVIAHVLQPKLLPREMPDSKNLKSLACIALVAVSPVLSSFGTNNQLFPHFTFNMALWGALFGLGIVVLFTIPPSTMLKSLSSLFLIAAPILVLGTMIVEDSQNPYRTARYEDQTYRVGGTTPFRDLLLTETEALRVRWFESRGQDFKNVPAVTIGSPGSIVAFNNNSFANPFTDVFWPGSFGTISEKCNAELPKKLVVLLPAVYSVESEGYGLLVSALENGCGFTFPEDFVFVDSFTPKDPLDISNSVAIWVTK